VFHLLYILSLGAVHGRDVPGRGMLWMLGGVMLKFAEHVGDVTRHGNVTCSVFVIPFQSYAGVYRSELVRC
jgi:hypothetical protein